MIDEKFVPPVISGLDYEGLTRCIHCGFCVQACPTYRQTQVETASPRGRLALMRAVAEGHLPMGEGVAGALDLCLGCRACESACPSGVPYGVLLEQARALTVAVKPAPRWVRWGLKHVLPYPSRLRLVRSLARFVQKTGLLRRLKLRPLKPQLDLARSLPPIGAGEYQASARPEQAQFFQGCIQEALLPQQNRAALTVLAHAGTACHLPKGQTCCGALHAHTGDLKAARNLARQNIAAFEQTKGPIIISGGGCGAHLKSYGHLLKDDPDWTERAYAFASRVQDFTEYMVDRTLALAPQPGLTVTYQDSCHLAHGQGVRRQPRALIQRIPGVQYREMNQADQCCGSAGLYNLLQSEMSGRVLSEKMTNVTATGATVIVTTNPGCYLQIRQGVEQRGLSDRICVLSLPELLLTVLTKEEN